ncbi:Gamma-glutamyl phosphate reductase [[Clostridium] cellulosi]|uniref:Gamma-glutamyl phosphate reductase n=1 Tax=[Clostridium] cellulosi TaxID=29343 RepID=A0A078KMG0_9FIRM|nr:Gamma-glutamyl phosphate reductase [[Clostridium] cellulosi]
MNLEEMGSRALVASRVLASAGTAKKNMALEYIADALIESAGSILSANEEDVKAAKNAGTRASMIDRLTLTEERIKGIADGVRKVALLEDPVGKSDGGWQRPNGLKIQKVRVPLGVIGIIYEARPNVTVDAAALCLKSGNACLLRGGRDALRSNLELARIMRKAIAKAGLPEDCVQVLEDTSHETAQKMMKLNKYIDVLIPRGGRGLIRSVVENSTVPVIETGAGNCHVYVDESADIDMAVNIIFNAKTSRPSVCNAAETLLVHKNIAREFLPRAKEMLDKKHVELRGDELTREILGNSVVPATEEDWETEYNDYILAVKTVSSTDEAIAHINKYGTRHSEAIVTDSFANSQKFLREVDAAAVYVNASTRFTDGNEFGFGAEIGISTQKLHARGPMGLDELTTVKYQIIGSGQVR